MSAVCGVDLQQWFVFKLMALFFKKCFLVSSYVTPFNTGIEVLKFIYSSSGCKVDGPFLEST